MIVLYQPPWTHDYERAAARIDKALQQTLVWAGFDRVSTTAKMIVKDVRILRQYEFDKQETQLTSERLQVLVLEGWRSPSLVWSDEDRIATVESIQ